MKKIKNKGELDILLKKNKHVFLLFYADWCTLGKSLFPIIKQLEKPYKKEVVFVKIDIEKHKDLKTAYKVISLPLIIIVKHKDVKQKLIGIQSKESIEEVIKKALASDEKETNKEK